MLCLQTINSQENCELQAPKRRIRQLLHLEADSARRLVSSRCTFFALRFATLSRSHVPANSSSSSCSDSESTSISPSCASSAPSSQPTSHPLRVPSALPARPCSSQ